MATVHTIVASYHLNRMEFPRDPGFQTEAMTSAYHGLRPEVKSKTAKLPETSVHLYICL